MAKNKDLPLLLLDNSSMMTAINQGEFKCTNLSFEEARAILEMYEDDEVICGFTNPAIESIIFEHLGIACKHYRYQSIRNIRPNQDAIAFKLYVTPSETQPIIEVEGVEAKKIQNVYVYCQFIGRKPEP